MIKSVSFWTDPADLGFSRGYACGSIEVPGGVEKIKGPEYKGLKPFIPGKLDRLVDERPADSPAPFLGFDNEPSELGCGVTVICVK